MAANVTGQMTKEGRVESLTELLAALVGTAATLHLYQASISPDPGFLEADFIAGEADFTGYAPAALTYGAVGLDAAGLAVAWGDRVFFQNTTNATGNSIGGAWISVEVSTGPSVNKAMAWFPFPNPVPMASPLASIAVTPVAVAPDLSGYAILDT